MEEQIKKSAKDLFSSRNWIIWCGLGIVCLVAIFLRPLLFILAVVSFARALWLAWPLIEKQLKENR
jgi:hypothetical protein